MALRVYLTVYFIAIAMALIALWQGGVLGRLPAVWVLLTVGVAVALGLALALLSRRTNSA